MRNDLALAEDALGQLLMELGETRLAEEGFRRALQSLERLVAEFPTVPRFREALAKASNSLGMIEQADGRSADSEAHYRRELAEAERLTQDFPDRPEFRRELARGCTNLGGLLAEQSRAGEAETILRKGISLNADLTAKQPADVQVRLDLAKCRNNLGYLLLEKGQTDGSDRRAGASAQPELGTGPAVSRCAPLCSQPGRRPAKSGQSVRSGGPGHGPVKLSGISQDQREAGKRLSRPTWITRSSWVDA